MNISTASRPEYTGDETPRLAELFRLLAQPARLRILLALRAGQACVCHLEVALKLRQAYLSQQLMLLRDAGLVSSARDGRNIYYWLADPRLPELIANAARLLGADLPDEAWPNANGAALPGCPCPRCAEASGIPTEQACQINCDPD